MRAALTNIYRKQRNKPDKGFANLNPGKTISAEILR